MHDAPNETLTAMAKSVCAMYASGKTESEVLELVRQASVMLKIGDDGMTVVRAAVTTMCPQNG
jgi:hypothetical protein